MKIRVLAGIVLAASFAFAAKAPQTEITIALKDQFDKPVVSAAVILDWLGNHQITKLGMRKKIHWEVRSNNEGIAHFPSIPQGIVQVQVIAKNLKTFGDKFDADEEHKLIPIKMLPPQEQYSAHDPLKPAEPKN